MRRMKVGGLGLLVCLMLATSACRGKYTPVPTEGVVTWNGKPVAGATVQFVVIGDDKEGRMAWGTTDKEGKFQLSTKGDNDGALPREYRVLVVKHVPLKPEAEAAARKRFAGEARMTQDDILYEVYGNGPRTKNVYPEKYASAENTPFHVTVPHDGPVILEMKSQ